MEKLDTITGYIRSLYPDMDPVLLHCPKFFGNEKKYLIECIDTKYVSYVGRFVTAMEDKIKEITGVSFAVAMVNGTAALHMTLLSLGIGAGDEVITQSLTFAASAAGIAHSGATPVFVDVDRDTMGMSPESLKDFLDRRCIRKNDAVIDKETNRPIKAVLPVHIFGHPVRIEAIKQICESYNLILLEDAAESLGSYRNGKHTGTTGEAAILSFNGNKLVTTGGGGMVITNRKDIADRARYISTTAKRPHPWEFYHDEIGYNLRMPSLNAAVGLAQLEYFDRILANKRETAELYHKFFASLGIETFKEPIGCSSNYWLNAVLLSSRAEREEFLQYTNDRKVQTRPIWTLLHRLPPYANCPRTELPVAEWFEERVVNIPSGVRG
jgi:perosamine synthetase